MKPNEVETLLQKALPHTLIKVESADQVHFEVLAVSEAFTHQSRIARQRIVYSVLGPYLQSGEIHALALKTYSPEEWKKEDIHE